MSKKKSPEQERFAKIVARYERLCSQMRESTRHPAKECGAGAEMLFQGLPVLSSVERLALSFTEGLYESFSEGLHRRYSGEL